MRTALYRFRDRDARLLYVGITGHLGRRIAQHEREKDWWEDVAAATVEHYATRDEALAAERIAIETEGPLYNVEHASPTPLNRPARLRLRWSPAVIWVCSLCGCRIADEEGTVALDDETGTWSALHFACDPCPDAGTYAFPVASLRSWRAFDSWLRYLSAKPWIAGTDFREFLDRHLARLNRRSA